MKLKLGNRTSDILITIYVIITIFGRIYIESLFKIGALSSLFMGVLTLLVLWALIKIKFLNPVWFGLFNKKNK
ncbi:hypothetical protein [Lutibacter sp.]|uniref:hypothetical protein n=1 Tax=Lutibacter sp. TaxID=1925666 RepID=UPI00356195F2